jgi:hypothetical protein
MDHIWIYSDAQHDALTHLSLFPYIIDEAFWTKQHSGMKDKVLPSPVRQA